MPRNRLDAKVIPDGIVGSLTPTPSILPPLTFHLIDLIIGLYFALNELQGEPKGRL